MFTVNTTGIEEAIREADDIIAQIERGPVDELEWFGKTTTDEMVRTHTFQNRTFRLESSIGYQVYPILGHIFRVKVEATAPYASQVEEGHPGPPAARPYPFFYPVFWAHEPMLQQRVQAWLDHTLSPRQSLLAASA